LFGSDSTPPGHNRRAALKIYKRYRKNADVVLFTGDARRFLASIPDRSIKLIVTSPPYNVGKAYESRKAIKSYLDDQGSVISELCRVLRDDGSICWQTGNYIEKGEVYPLDIHYYPLFKSLNLRLRGRIIWKFGHGLHASRRFSGRYETILWFTKGDRYTFNLDAIRVPSKYPGKRAYKGPAKGKPSGNPSGKNPSDVWDLLNADWDTKIWDIPNVKARHPEKTAHPAQFPVELAERCVLALTNRRDIVFDPYAGVGSTMIAALKDGRRAYGSEADPKYVEIAQDRINRLVKGDLKLRHLGTPVYVPGANERVAQIPSEWLNGHPTSYQTTLLEP